MTLGNRWRLLTLGLVLAAAALWTAPAGAWLFDAVTPVAHEVRNLFWKAVGITAFFFILAEGILLVAVLKFRAKPGRAPAKWR